MDLVGIDQAVETQDLHVDPVAVSLQNEMVATERLVVNDDILGRIAAQGDDLAKAQRKSDGIARKINHKPHIVLLGGQLVQVSRRLGRSIRLCLLGRPIGFSNRLRRRPIRFCRWLGRTIGFHNRRRLIGFG